MCKVGLTPGSRTPGSPDFCAGWMRWKGGELFHWFDQRETACGVWHGGEVETEAGQVDPKRVCGTCVMVVEGRLMGAVKKERG